MTPMAESEGDGKGEGGGVYGEYIQGIALLFPIDGKFHRHSHFHKD